jgi:DNA-binding response OmpR family regulator
MITILVIDADPAVRLTARRVLERAGFTVIAAADRRSALARLASLKADLVICDIGEDRNGGPTLRELGSWDSGMRMLVLSHKERGGSPTADAVTSDILGKPFTESELLMAVRRSLARGPRALSGGAAPPTRSSNRSAPP